MNNFEKAYFEIILEENNMISDRDEMAGQK